MERGIWEQYVATKHQTDTTAASTDATIVERVCSSRPEEDVRQWWTPPAALHGNGHKVDFLAYSRNGKLGTAWGLWFYSRR